jgi:hypothetical protein
MIRDDAFEKLYGSENEETAETGAVDWCDSVSNSTGRSAICA